MNARAWYYILLSRLFCMTCVWFVSSVFVLSCWHNLTASNPRTTCLEPISHTGTFRTQHALPIHPSQSAHKTLTHDSIHPHSKIITRTHSVLITYHHALPGRCQVTQRSSPHAQHYQQVQVGAHSARLAASPPHLLQQDSRGLEAERHRDHRARQACAPAGQAGAFFFTLRRECVRVHVENDAPMYCSNNDCCT
jgi:hypothetical protein